MRRRRRAAQHRGVAARRRPHRHRDPPRGAGPVRHASGPAPEPAGRPVPHRRRPVAAAQHARRHPPLGAHVPGPRARRPSSTTPASTTPRPAADHRGELHDLLAVRIESLPLPELRDRLERRRHDLLGACVAARGGRRPAGARQRVPGRRIPTRPSVRLACAPMQFDNEMTTVRRPAPRHRASTPTRSSPSSATTRPRWRRCGRRAPSRRQWRRHARNVTRWPTASSGSKSRILASPPGPRRGLRGLERRRRRRVHRGGLADPARRRDPVRERSTRRSTSTSSPAARRSSWSTGSPGRSTGPRTCSHPSGSPSGTSSCCAASSRATGGGRSAGP